MDYSKIVSESWAEAIFVILVLISFLIALSLNSALLAYIVITLSGFLAGRFFFQRRIAQPIFPFLMIMFGFLVGFLIGSPWANKFVVIILFVGAAITSYFLHQRGYLEFFKTAGFIR